MQAADHVVRRRRRRRALRPVAIRHRVPHRPRVRPTLRLRASTARCATRRVTSERRDARQPPPRRCSSRRDTMTGRFFASPSRPARATGSASCQRKLGTLLGSNVGARLELRLREPGREDGNRDPGSFELLVDGLGEREHERLRRGVGRVVRRRLVARERQRRSGSRRVPRSTIPPAAAWVSRTTASTLRRISRSSVSRSSSWKLPNVPNPALLINMSTSRGARLDAARDRPHRSGRLRAPRRESPCVASSSFGERFETGAIARDEHEVVAALGEDARELLTDPDRTRR